MLNFTLFKIPVSVHWMFWALAAFLGGGLRAQSAQDWHRVILFMAAVFISIIIHELGHALAGIRFGASTPSIQLHGLGGIAGFRQDQLNRRQRILLTLAGPGASILLAIAFFGIAIVLYQSGQPSSYPQILINYFVDVMVTINVFWTIINLFPVLPLDGGQILRESLGPNRLRLTCIISLMTLIVLASLLWIETRSIYNMIVMAFLGSYTWNTLQQSK
ncbi:MAG TPA: hypothetical protein DIV79_13900 [Opitutae bacterium]|nr:hypothetical protein [Opitutaceae bacterium]HCR31101.1 hypothetical protein [Opitutae bacterium]|tara:strand:+ start:301 stop:954 length:654 start_codon:yes stop_codon:yes gene_type:complete